ncbi:polysaccharide deacetylase family protein [Cellulosimicrobium sp. NPDC057127]|uniref:polysaccharide deacetylase family protein n=1 Tax=Cellulosimicrobium sp. NPDC057127 TaxID=3346026 RepID=UPI00362D84BA
MTTPRVVGRNRRRWWWAAVPVVVALVAVALVLVARAEHRTWVAAVERYEDAVAQEAARAEAARARAEEELVAPLAALTGALDEGRAVLAASDGQVADPAVRETLADAVDDGERLRTTEPGWTTQERTVDGLTRPNPLHPGSRPERSFVLVTGSTPAPDELAAAAEAVAASSAAVVVAQRQWAYDHLQTAVTAGRPVLTESAGLVADEGTRTALDAALADADAVLDAGAGGVVVADAVALRDAVVAATEAVWADRLARTLAERRAQGRASGVDCAAERCVALTFDDGPDHETERLLQVLADKRATATFFMVGRNVAARPEVAAAVVAGGHLVANHSWDHPRLTTLDDDEIDDQLERTQTAIRDATGATPTFLRPPYGDVDDRVRSIATRAGLRVELWDVDTQDWRTRDAEETRRRVAAQVEPGSVVLLHDIHASSVDAVAGIVDDLREQGYRLVTVDLLVP